MHMGLITTDGITHDGLRGGVVGEISKEWDIKAEEKFGWEHN